MRQKRARKVSRWPLDPDTHIIVERARGIPCAGVLILNRMAPISRRVRHTAVRLPCEKTAICLFAGLDPVNFWWLIETIRIETVQKRIDNVMTRRVASPFFGRSLWSKAVWSWHIRAKLHTWHALRIFKQGHQSTSIVRVYASCERLHDIQARQLVAGGMRNGQLCHS